MARRAAVVGLTTDAGLLPHPWRDCNHVGTSRLCLKSRAPAQPHQDATRGKFDISAAWSVDRLGRSLKDLLGFLTEIHALGVGLHLHQQAVDTTTPAGKALFQMMGVFAEFERAMIRERVMAGLKRARANHVQLGRPKVTAEIEQRVKAELAKGTGILKSARRLGVGTGTVQRTKSEMLTAL
jgi:DNA invertase Pin-like site-specific DNA recombinase